MVIELRKQHNCNRCGYRWFSRLRTPKNCPHCKSPYWNKERVYNTGRGELEEVAEKDAQGYITYKRRVTIDNKNLGDIQEPIIVK